MSDWPSDLKRWIDAGLVDATTAERIRAFESARAGGLHLRWPMLLALAFGAALLAAAVLLFVSAYWDALSPSGRMAVVIGFVGLFHTGGAAAHSRWPGLSSALHAVGTISLGAGIFLAGQIFNLEEHWPTGVLFWLIGAAAAWWLLKDWPQMALVALLAPAWLTSEWTVRSGSSTDAAAVATAGLLLLALTYFTAPAEDDRRLQRRVLLWIGGLAWPIAAASMAVVFSEVSGLNDLVGSEFGLGWVVAIALPLALALMLHRRDAWMNGVSAVWVIALATFDDAPGLLKYAWWALGAIGLIAWGVKVRRSERVNFGSALFGAVLIAFYFSEVMDKLDRSVSLFGLGVLFLAGGWTLERTRRRLIRQTEKSS